MMMRNSDFNGSLRLACDDAQAIAERQAGADAAHDDVDGVRQLEDELVDAALPEIAQHPARQADAAREGGPGGAERLLAWYEDHDAEHSRRHALKM